MLLVQGKTAFAQFLKNVIHRNRTEQLAAHAGLDGDCYADVL